MNGQNVVIIGGSSGIGLATARRVVADGAKVTIVGRSRTAVDAAVAELGSGAHGAAFDASDRAALDACFRECKSIDHLVLAASGGGGGGAFSDLSADDLRRGFDAKFWVHWQATQAALPYLAAEGSIVFVTAASSRLANPGTSGLAAINGALERMARTLARELAPIRVNAVSPGVVDTAWWAKKPPGAMQTASAQAPLKRPGRPEEIADAISFLMRATFVTGVILDVDGGLHLT